MCEVTEWQQDGQRVVTLAPRRNRSDWHIIYLHGGGYINPLSKPQWDIIEAMIDATGASVTAPLYALAPEHDYQPGTKLVHAVYDKVQADHPEARIAVSGDSAGATLR